MSRHELTAGLDYVRAVLTALKAEAETRSLTDDEWTQVRDGLAFCADAEEKLARYADLDKLAETRSVEPGFKAEPFQTVRKDETPFDVLETRAASPREFSRKVVDGSLRAIEEFNHEPENLEHFERSIKRQAAGDPQWAAGLLARMRPEYIDGYQKLLSGHAMLLTNEERTALSVGSNTNGGFLLPTHIDPTVILTNNGSNNIMRRLARVEQLSAPGATSWNGVTSAGVTASFDAELAEVSDDSPTFARPGITVHMARAFVQAAIEATQDIAGLAGEVMMMFADARDVLEGAKFVSGSGTNEPWGIFDALDANTNVEITSTTAATVGTVDLHSVYRQVPQRWRGRSVWLMHPQVALAIKELGTAISASYSGDLREPTAGRILGRDVFESDDCDNVYTTTALDNRLILGDFSNYVIVDKPGSMAVEFIPHLFNTTTNLPDARRGWFAYWRTGGDSVNDVAFRLLQDKTSV